MKLAATDSTHDTLTRCFDNSRITVKAEAERRITTKHKCVRNSSPVKMVQKTSVKIWSSYRRMKLMRILIAECSCDDDDMDTMSAVRTFSDALRPRIVVFWRHDESVVSASESSNMIATLSSSSVLDVSTRLNTSSRRLYVARIQLSMSSYCPAT